MKQLVRIRTRPSRDGKTFVYMLDFVDIEGEYLWAIPTDERPKARESKPNEN